MAWEKDHKSVTSECDFLKMVLKCCKKENWKKWLSVKRTILSYKAKLVKMGLEPFWSLRSSLAQKWLMRDVLKRNFMNRMENSKIWVKKRGILRFYIVRIWLRHFESLWLFWYALECWSWPVWSISLIIWMKLHWILVLGWFYVNFKLWMVEFV